MNGPEDGIWIPGEPATFATAMEKPWKERVFSRLRDVPDPGGLLELAFHLSPGRFSWRGCDLDNLCEPVFAVMASRLGWFGGKQAGIPGWRAVKVSSAEPGLRLRRLSENTAGFGAPAALFDREYFGLLPRGARSPEILEWLHSLEGLPRPKGAMRLALHFVNVRRSIASLSGGMVKPAIDCLFPLIGGRAGDPDDHLIHELVVLRRQDGSRAPHLRIVLGESVKPAGEAG